MQSGSQRKWWQLRRVRWPAAALVTIALATGVAIVRSAASRVVVYNDTGGVIEELSVSACGQSQTFRAVHERESVRFKIQARGEASEITITTNGAVMWRGDYLEPSGGYRAIVRLRRDRQAECTTTISVWQKLLRSQP